MGAVTTLSTNQLSVDPGGEVICLVTVRNTGSVVDEFSLSVVGETGQWASIEPRTMSLVPGKDQVAQVRFRPPRSAQVTAGEWPFGIKVACREDSTGSVVEEGVIEVAPFADVSAELIPRNSRGRFGERHTVALDNRGNAPASAVMTASDPDNLLTFRFDPAGLVAEPNTAAFGRVRIRPRKRFVRGPAKTHTFQVQVQPETAPPVTVDGTFLQEALIPRSLPVILLAVLAVGVLWVTLLKPTVETAAQNVVPPELEKNVAELQQKVGALEAKSAGNEAAVATLAASVSKPARAPRPFDRRLQADAKPGTTDTRTFTVADGDVLSLSYLLLQNPAADAGILELRRGEDVIVRVNLATFVDLDYPFVAPVVFQPGQQLVLSVQCANPDTKACSPAAYVAGNLTDFEPPKPSDG